MPKFTVVEHRGGERLLVEWEEMELFIEITPPADAEHAEKVAAFLNEHVESATFDPNSLPPIGLRG